MKPLAWVIEDDATLTTVFAEALKSAGYDVEVITDGQTALDRLDESVPTIVILDLHLPKASGREVLSKIRASERFAGTRIVITSADAALADSLQDEADLVLIKPVSFHQLRELSARLKP